MLHKMLLPSHFHCDQVEKLTAGMLLMGVVKNVVAFGAFVDVGVGCDGLLHV